MKSAPKKKSEEHDPTWYWRSPEIRKWLHQCLGCQRIGYRPDAPSSYLGREQVLKHLQPITVDESGLCEECHHAALGE